LGTDPKVAPYPPQFRAMVVELVRAGRTLASLKNR
jgi:hypothetical protein